MVERPVREDYAIDEIPAIDAPRHAQRRGDEMRDQQPTAPQAAHGYAMPRGEGMLSRLVRNLAETDTNQS